MKQCTKCKKRKDKSEFGKNRSCKDGLSSRCKECNAEYSRKRYEKNKNRGPAKYLRYEKRHRVVDGVKQKRCSKCKRWKAESDFYKRRSNKDGLAVRCKECSDKATNKCRRRQTAVRN